MSQPSMAQGGEFYATFCGDMDTDGLRRLFAGIAGVTEVGGRRLHLVFESSGGLMGDGVCLYNYFRSLPLELTVYNLGTIQSSAVIERHELHLSAHEAEEAGVVQGIAPFAPPYGARLYFF